MTQSSLGTILLVCTSHAELGDTGNPTGLWMEEMTAPYYVLKDGGYDVVIVSPTGGKPPIDPGSMNKAMQGPSVARFEADDTAFAAFSSSRKLSEITDMNAYQGIFLAGGHGTMWDFPQDAKLGDLLEQAVSANKAVAAVCHGVAGLLAGDVASSLKGKSVAGFSNAEESTVGLTDVVPFLLETELKEVGLKYSCADVFTPHVVTDGNLVTGQNPVSSQGVAEAMITALTSG